MLNGGRFKTCAIKQPVDLNGHDEVVLMEALDFLGLQDDFCMASSEIDFRVMPLGLCEIADTYDEAHCFTKILEAERALDAMRIVEQFPNLWHLLEASRLLHA